MFVCYIQMLKGYINPESYGRSIKLSSTLIDTTKNWDLQRSILSPFLSKFFKMRYGTSLKFVNLS